MSSCVGLNAAGEHTSTRGHAFWRQEISIMRETMGANVHMRPVELLQYQQMSASLPPLVRMHSNARLHVHTRTVVPRQLPPPPHPFLSFFFFLSFFLFLSTKPAFSMTHAEEQGVANYQTDVNVCVTMLRGAQLPHRCFVFPPLTPLFFFTQHPLCSRPSEDGPVPPLAPPETTPSASHTS